MILLDLVMPGLSGFDMARRIREKSLFKRPFLIAMSGMANDANRRMAAEAGFDMAYAKPVDCDHLKGVLQRFSHLIDETDASPLGPNERHESADLKRP